MFSSLEHFKCIIHSILSGRYFNDSWLHLLVKEYYAGVDLLVKNSVDRPIRHYIQSKLQMISNKYLGIGTSWHWYFLASTNKKWRSFSMKAAIFDTQWKSKVLMTLNIFSKLLFFHLFPKRTEKFIIFLVFWRLRYSLQRVEPLVVQPVGSLDRNSLATWTIVHLAFESVEFPWDSLVLLLLEPSSVAEHSLAPHSLHPRCSKAHNRLTSFMMKIVPDEMVS